MKNTTVFCFLCVSLYVSFSARARSSEYNVRSKVTAVTVYSDRALITRTAKQFLPAGTQTVIFGGLPVSLLDESMKVVGASEVNAKIVDVKIEESFLDTIPATRAYEIAGRLSELRTKKNEVDSRRLVVMAQMNTVDSIRANYARSLSGSNPGQKAMTDEWEKLLQFMGNKKTEYNERIEEYQRETGSLLRQIETAEKELQSINGQTRRSVKVLSVVLAMPRADSVRLDVSYIVPQAQWSPLYEARVSAADSLLQIVYTGQVAQSTGEDWNDIDLVLSTAQPALGSTSPKLQRWNVDFQASGASPYSIPSASLNRSRPSSHMINPKGRTLSGKVLDGSTMEPLTGANVFLEGTTLGASTDMNGEFVIYNIPDGVYTARASYVGYATDVITDIRINTQTGAAETFYLTATNVQISEVMIRADRPLIQKSATNAVRLVDMERSDVSSQSTLTSAVFRIVSRQSIPTDGQTHKVGIAVENLPVVFEYQSTPKIVAATYLQAKGKNTTSYPFLSGPVNVFFENAFIAISHLRTVMPNDSFAISCGIDEGIHVERKMVQRFTEQVGTFSRKIRVTYEYDLLVNNLRTRNVSLSLHDQVPVSRNEDVTVKVIEPPDTELKPDADGVLTWILNLPPESKRTVKLKFSVEYPRDLRLYGLE